MTDFDTEFSESDPPEAPAAPSRFLLGGWVLLPTSIGVAGENAFLERDGERVPLLHCSVDLREFAELMAGIEARFTRHYEQRPLPEQLQ